MKRIRLIANFTIAGQQYQALENRDGVGEYRSLAIDPNKTISEFLKDLDLTATKSTIGELIAAMAAAPTLAEDIPV